MSQDAAPPRATGGALAGPARPSQSGPGPDHSPGRPAAHPAPPLPAHTLTAAGDLLRALAAPVRISIVLQLRAADRCVHELVDALGVAQPLISQHLRVLKAAGVVRGERHGREVVYRLVDEHLAHIVVDAVSHVQEPVPARAPGTITRLAPAVPDARTEEA